MYWLPISVAVASSAVALLLLAHAPRWWHSRREPTDAEADRLGEVCASVDVAPDRLVVLRTSNGATDDVQLAGLPGRRELLVTEATLERLDDASLRALLAGAVERARFRIEVVQALAAGIAVGLLASVYVTPLSFAAGMVSMWLFALAAFAVCRRLHYAADARAADAVGAQLLADVLEQTVTGDGTEPETGSWRTFFEVEPPTGERVARLRRSG